MDKKITKVLLIFCFTISLYLCWYIIAGRTSLSSDFPQQTQQGNKVVFSDRDLSRLPLCERFRREKRARRRSESSLAATDKNLTVSLTYPELSTLETKYKDVICEGRYTPNCKPRSRVAILVPFRDRHEHLKAFLDNNLAYWTRMHLGVWKFPNLIGSLRYCTNKNKCRNTT